MSPPPQACSLHRDSFHLSEWVSPAHRSLQQVEPHHFFPFLCDSDPCLFIYNNCCCIHLGSLQYWMLSFISEPRHCVKHSCSFSKATECAMLCLGLGGGIQIGPEGGPQHHACCIAGTHTHAPLCPYRPVSVGVHGSILWHPAHLPPPVRSVGLRPVHWGKDHWCLSTFARKQMVFKPRLRL